MYIQKTIETLIPNTEEIKKSYPSVAKVRHDIKDIPYHVLNDYAIAHAKTVYTDQAESRTYILCIESNCDIWLYSTIVKIKPAEITEL